MSKHIQNSSTGSTVLDLKVGGETDYTEIGSDGVMVARGAAMQQDDVYPAAVSVGVAGANIPQFTAFNGGLKAYEFPGAATLKELNLAWQLPHQREDGTNITPHIHVRIPNDASGGNIRFGLELIWANQGDTEAATTTIYADLDIAPNAGNLANEIISFGELDGTGKTYSSLVQARLFRNPAATEDTFGSSVWLMSADIHVQKSRLGQ